MKMSNINQDSNEMKEKDMNNNHIKDHSIYNNDNIERQHEIQRVLDTYNIKSINNKKKRKLVEMNNEAFQSYELGLKIAKCCKDMDVDEAFKSYQEAVDKNIYPNYITFINLLSLTAGLGNQGSGQAYKRIQVPPYNLKAALCIYNDMLTRDFPIPESVFTALIRCCCLNKQPEKAIEFYYKLQKLDIIPRLRTFSRLLDVLSQPNDPNLKNYELCQQVYNELVNKYLLQPTEIEYVYMLRLCLNTKDEILFNEIILSLMNNIPLPESKAIRNIIVKWFETTDCFLNNYIIIESNVSNDGIVICNKEQLLSIDLDDIHRNELLNQINGFVLHGNENELINDKNGISCKMNNKVKAYHEQQQKIKNLTKECVNKREDNAKSNINNNDEKIDNDQNVSNVISSNIVNDLKKNEKKQDNTTKQEKILNYREKIWDSFKNWLEIHHQSSSQDTIPPSLQDTIVPYLQDTNIEDVDNKNQDLLNKGFTIIIDGANVGYCKQNYPGAPIHIDYFQINQLILHLLKIGYKPLLILHCRHLNPQMVPNQQCQDLITYWQKHHLIYSTPKGFNDDWFWLYAAVKYHCKVITNDEMRDHHFQLFHPKWFSKWSERNRIQFTFGKWRDQQIRQQHNASRKNGQIFALLNAPINHTTDDDNIISNNNNNSNDNDKKNIMIKDSIEYNDSIESSDNDYDDIYSNNITNTSINTSNHKKYQRKVYLQWPCIYSYAIQNIINNNYIGYYIPPIPCKERSRIINQDSYDDIFKDIDDKVDEVIVSTKLEYKEWLCIYKSTSVINNETNHNDNDNKIIDIISNKRKYMEHSS